jgi:hypothetical protein
MVSSVTINAIYYESVKDLDLTIQGEKFNGGFLGRGWSGREPNGTWTEGKVAELEFLINETQLKNDLFLDIDIQYRLTDSITVFANSSIISDNLHVENGSKLHIRIPKTVYTRGRELIIEIYLNNPKRPTDINPNSTDRRELGIMISAISLYEEQS